jgi:hypothetical protein
LGDALHFLELEHFAALAADRGFDLNGTDWYGDAAGCAPRGFAFEIGDGEGGFTGGERDEVEAAEGLAAISAIVEEMALLLDHHTALFAGEEADGEVVGEGAGREPDGGFFAESRSDGLFELGDDATEGVAIGFDGRRELLEKCGVFDRRVMDTVAGGLNREGLGGVGGRGGGRSE